MGRMYIAPFDGLSVTTDSTQDIWEITAGSGYWSVDSAVPVLGGTARATAVRVRWPGGQWESFGTAQASHCPSRFIGTPGREGAEG